MKILHIITRMNTGGPAVFLDHLTTSLNELKYENLIAYGYCEKNESDYTEQSKIKTDLIKVRSLHRSLNIKDDLQAFLQLRKIIKQIKPDLINTHTSKAGVLGRVAAKTIRRPISVVHTYHGHLIYGYFAKYKSFIFTIIEKFMSLFTNTAIAVTNETKSSLIKLGIGRKLNWQVIPIGIPNQNTSTQSFSARGIFKMLWVGRFTDIKDPLYAVDVIQILNTKSPDVFELTMVGEGELFEKVKATAFNLPIIFKGWQRAPFEQIKDFDLLLLTSKNEGLPLVMLEAASCARATLSRNVGGVGEFIKDQQSGYLVDGPPAEMAEKLLVIASDKDGLINIGKAANRLVKEEFSVEKMAKRYSDLYSSLIIRG